MRLATLAAQAIWAFCGVSLACSAQNASFRIEGMEAPRDVEFVARVDGSRQGYVEFLPKGYSPNKPSPLMIFLHGHGSDRWQIAQGSQWKEIQAVCDVAARHKTLLLSPDYRARTSWMGPLAEADLLQLIDEQKARRKIGKIILAGGSMGGTSVLIFSALHPDQVNGVISMNGTANMLEYSGFQDFIASAYGGTKELKPDEYRNRSPELVPEKFKGIPVAFTAGGKDTVVPAHSVLRLSRKLEAQDPAGTLMLYREPGGHSTSYEDAVKALEFVLERAGL
jgi:pimeloyl-ACP methyl ester carboxylesterase